MTENGVDLIKVEQISLEGKTVRLKQQMSVSGMKFVQDAFMDFLDRYKKLDEFIDAKEFLRHHFGMVPDKTEELRALVVSKNGRASPTKVETTRRQLDDVANHFQLKTVTSEEIREFVHGTFGKPDTGEAGVEYSKKLTKKIIEDCIKRKDIISRNGASRGTTYTFRSVKA